MLKPAMMDLKQRQEQLSHAYVQAVASAAGFSTYKPSVDDDSIDIGILSRGSGLKLKSPRLELQLKAPFKRNLVIANGMSYQISRKNYDDLRAAVLVPRLLVVLMLADDEQDWLHWSEEQLILRHCAFWTSLDGLPDLPIAQDDKNIRFSREKPFNVESLTALMKTIADRGTL
jgi:hypothetical protein